ALDGAGIADLGIGLVLAELPPGPSLAQQVPALVELDLDARELGVLDLRRDVAGTDPPAQLVLLLDQTLDAALDVLVAHAVTVGAAESASVSVSASASMRGRPRERR